MGRGLLLHLAEPSGQTVRAGYPTWPRQVRSRFRLLDSVGAQSTRDWAVPSVMSEINWLPLLVVFPYIRVVGDSPSVALSADA